MIRFALILLLCLATPAFAQQKETKPATSEKEAGQKSKPAKQGDRSETKSTKSNSDQDDDSKKTTDKDAEDEKEKADPTNTAMLAGALKFRSVGPAFMSGRIGDIAIDQENPNTWYVAAASGGLWKTSNAGTTFKPIFDSQKSYSIGCVTIDPSTNSTIWVGTGENNGGRHIGFGDGIYVSYDSGNTWKLKGLEKSEHLSKIIVDPRDSNIVFAASQGPLWLSLIHI